MLPAPSWFFNWGLDSADVPGLSTISKVETFVSDQRDVDALYTASSMRLSGPSSAAKDPSVLSPFPPTKLSYASNEPREAGLAADISVLTSSIGPSITS